MEGIIILGFIVLAFTILGSICGIVALSRTQRVAKDLEDLRKQLRSLREYYRIYERQPSDTGEESVPLLEPAPVRVAEPSLVRPDQRDIKTPVPTPASEQVLSPTQPYRPPSESLENLKHLASDLEGVAEQLRSVHVQKGFEAPRPPVTPKEEQVTAPSPPPSGTSTQSLEMRLGTKWLNWVGIVMLLVGIGFFLKYAYDNAWIGPKGRLAIGVLLGIVALGMGERFRRRDWSVLFQILTGGGLAIFYLCVFFSFQAYHLAEQGLAMLLAVLVTALAVAMAVAFDEVSIAVLAVVGGFLSPVLLSTGTNHPYALFIYIAILDMVALGAAYFRRWRVLDLICFIGTIVMYAGWHQRFYAPSQMTPALLFTTLFYLMFLLIPTLHGLVRRLSIPTEGLAVIVFSALFSFISYYDILFPDDRYFMGFTVLGQALLVFLLFQAWNRRMGMANDISASFLMITLGLVLIVIPIQLKLYGIPIAWSVEGTVLVFLGIRFRQIICRAAGAVALLLAAGGLLYRLPLHRVLFTPVLNVPFGSWSLVIAMTAFSAYLFHKDQTDQEKWNRGFAGFSFLLALSLLCSLLTMELSQFWTINHPIAHYRTYETGFLVALWSLISMIIASVLLRKRAPSWMPLPWVCYGIGAVILFAGIQHASFPSRWLALNVSFLPRLTFVLSLWAGVSLSRRLGLKYAADVQAMAGHAILAIVVAFEFVRWSHYSSLITPKMGVSLISAAWAVQAFVVIWIGLARKTLLLRYLGFVLFLLAVGKTLFIDTSELEKVYRIVSFVACGLLLVGAGYFYQRYSSRLLEQPETEAQT